MARHHLIPRVLCAILALSGSFLQAAAAYECHRCPKRDIAVFDLSAPPIDQDALLSYPDWTTMHLEGFGVLEALMNEDSSLECLVIKDAQMATGGSGSNYQHGMTSFPAPAGPVPGADYIITGDIAVPALGSGLAGSDGATRTDARGRQHHP